MADTPWDMLSAIGTVAAVVVALGISGQAAWANRRAETDRSELAAAKMLGPLFALERKSASLTACFAFGETEFSNSEPYVLKLLEELDALSKSVLINDLYPLLKLPNHAAKRSALALGLIHTLVSDARSMLLNQHWVNMKNTEKAFQYKRWLSMTSEIYEHLIAAVRVFESAAAVGAPRPSQEEIYGVAPYDQNEH
ncbi:hypothetical protein [Pseudomonas sp. KK4]|uniref:hypothetical protein n=1 Tax=Pseudomonas sp. KK4 TaxID=1855729 RepID=UPI00097CAB2B|nr:hypothetical protein [Pseudomonas sp. KK4]